MQKTLTSRGDKVSQRPNARNAGQLYTAVQTANNQAKTTVDQEDVAKSLKGKGILSQKIDTLAEAIVARVNGQQLANTQRSVLSFELGRPAVQSVINELIKKKANGIDSTQSNGYDKDNVVGGFESREEAALWDFAKQKVGGDRSGVPGTLRGKDADLIIGIKTRYNAVKDLKLREGKVQYYWH